MWRLSQRRAAVLIPLFSPLTREDLSRFPTPCLVEYIPFIPLTSPVYLSTLPKSTSNPSTPPPKPARRGETLFVNASVSLLQHTHLYFYSTYLSGHSLTQWSLYLDLKLNLTVVLILTSCLDLL